MEKRTEAQRQIGIFRVKYEHYWSTSLWIHLPKKFEDSVIIYSPSCHSKPYDFCSSAEHKSRYVASFYTMKANGDQGQLDLCISDNTTF